MGKDLEKRAAGGRRLKPFLASCDDLVVCSGKIYIDARYIVVYMSTMGQTDWIS